MAGADEFFADAEPDVEVASEVARAPDGSGEVGNAKRVSSYPQHLWDCIGGHFTEPYEQNTQQFPGFGRRTVLHASHS